MTSSDHNNDYLVTSQEMLEWVTPKISMMTSEETEGGKYNYPVETLYTLNIPIPTIIKITVGPS